MIKDLFDISFGNKHNDVPDGDVKSICLNCGYEDTIPDFIYDEFSEKIKHKELKNDKKISTLNCSRCNKLKIIPKQYI